ncbi:MAG: hypothetical protein U9R49_04950, partial [Bacteroidota bacterium]|nr:hypothetical protein [Bacteroidota bacterium]
IYATLPVYRFLVRSYPHLEDMIEHRELEFGETVAPCEEMPFHLTTFPAFHGQSAVGASMLLFEHDERKILFTGDLLAPMLRKEDYASLMGVDLLVVDTNNRFPWPRTKHWSFAGSPEDPLIRSEILEAFAMELSWEKVSGPHVQEGISEKNRAYLSDLETVWNQREVPLTILEFLERIDANKVMLVHYSGAEDMKYSGEEILTSRGLQDWASETAEQAEFSGDILVPASGQRIQIDQDGKR